MAEVQRGLTLPEGGELKLKIEQGSSAGWAVFVGPSSLGGAGHSAYFSEAGDMLKWLKSGLAPDRSED